MKKLKDLLFFSCLFILPEFLLIFIVANKIPESNAFSVFWGVNTAFLLTWLGGCVFLLFRKSHCKKFSCLLTVACIASLCIVLPLIALSLFIANFPNIGSFCIQTPVFEDKSVMVIVPHQDDDINLVGGLIEPYIENNSEVTVVFTTNGDYRGLSEVRAKEVLAALTPMGIQKENIYYLGFGDKWTPKTFEQETINHIYLSPDPDTIWNSHFGATNTYGTKAIDCYLDLPYTKNNYVLSIRSLILEKKPEIIFAIDLDRHVDHEASSLLFETAMGQILKAEPDYHPTVYKGFGYSTAWQAIYDYYSDINPISTKQPEDDVWNQTSFAYRWEDRLRFPMGDQNRNLLLSNNSVFKALKAYQSATAYQMAPSVLNGDKVFWKRRTDSLLYNAHIQLDGQPTELLNNFQLVDLQNLDWQEGLLDDFSGAVECSQRTTIHIQLLETVTANCLTLYDHPDGTSNILSGSVSFSDGTTMDFGELEKSGSATNILFSDKELQWLEITITETEGTCPGLTEIELYWDTDAEQESFLMVLDPDDNFVYDYILQNEDSVVLKLYQFPYGNLSTFEDVSITFEATGAECDYTLEDNRLLIHCTKHETCTVTLSKDGASTTFTVSNPHNAKVYVVKLLRGVDWTSIQTEWRLKDNIRKLFSNTVK